MQFDIWCLYQVIFHNVVYLNLYFPYQIIQFKKDEFIDLKKLISSQ